MLYGGRSLANVAALRSGEMRLISCPHYLIRVFDGGDMYPDTGGRLLTSRAEQLHPGSGR